MKINTEKEIKTIVVTLCILLTTIFLPVMTAQDESKTGLFDQKKDESYVDDIKMPTPLLKKHISDHNDGVLSEDPVLSEHRDVIKSHSEDPVSEPMDFLDDKLLRYEDVDTQTDEEKPLFSPGEIIVKLKSNDNVKIITDKNGIAKTGLSTVDRLNDQYQVTSMEKVFKTKNKDDDSLDLSNIYKCILPDDSNILSIVEEYEKDTSVEYAQPNYIMETCLVPNDPYYQSLGTWNQEYLDLYSMHIIDASNAWDISTGNPNVVVAVVDTGVDYTHGDLTENMWINEDENATNGIDDDQDGFIDNVYGADFVGYDATFPTPDGDPMDDCWFGHGTHCAGTIGAIGNNSFAVVGVNWQTKIMAVKGLDWLGRGRIDDLADCIVWAADQGADVISNSWGSASRNPSDPVIEDAVRYAYNAGCIVVFAAGNSNDDARYFSPQNMDEVITVAATDYNDKKASFSNWGEKVDVCAPGVEILSLRSCHSTDWYAVDDNCSKMSGTSMACPQVAGLAALILAKNLTLGQEMIKTIIFNSVDTIDSPLYIGKGRINAHKALQKQSAIARLHPLLDWTDVKGTVDIIGSAWGESFQYYTLEIGIGRNPNYWFEIANSSLPNQDDVITSLDTTELNDGMYTVRLRVVCSYFYTDTIPMVINNEFNQFEVDDDNIDGPWDGTQEYPYQYIQDGVDAAGKDDIVYVHCGIYYENIVIDKKINLIGQNRIATIIDGCRVDNVVSLYSDGVVISDFTIKNAGGDTYIGKAGINVGSNNNVISRNVISNTYIGISLWNSTNNTVIQNTIRNVFYGIKFEIDETGRDTKISQNTFFDNEYCIYMFLRRRYSSIHDTVITGNLITKCYDGIHIKLGWNYLTQGPGGCSYDMVIANNTIANLSNSGIYIRTDDAIYHDCLIYENRFINNRYGYYRTNWGDSSDLEATRIYHNDFINNTEHVFCRIQGEIWDDGYPSGGNYWDDYNDSDIFSGPDQNISGSDGIGDTPYEINGSWAGFFYDNYPLMNPWNNNSIDTIYVDDDYNSSTPGWGIDHFDAIQDAIDTVAQTGTVYVSSGIYLENLVIDKSIKLIGENKNTTIIECSTPTDKVVCIKDTEFVTMKGFTIQKGTYGIYIDSSSDILIIDTIITDNKAPIYSDFLGAGIYLNASRYIEIVYNKILNNSWGIHLIKHTYDIHIYHNIIKNNKVSIIPEHFASEIIDTSILSDTITQSRTLKDTKIELNNFQISKSYMYGGGVKLSTTTSNNRINNNDFIDNYYGLRIDSKSNSNSIQRNNFNNSINAFDTGNNNSWDYGYPFGGNYWSNYTGVDENHGSNQDIPGSDGIGDTPYIIPGDGGQDRYPFIQLHEHPDYPVINTNTSEGFLNIQNAVDDDDTIEEHSIFVYAGIYYENVDITKPISIVGEDRNITIIDGSKGKGNVIDVLSNSVQIIGFTIQHTGNYERYDSAGIFLSDLSNTNTIYNNIIKDNIYGICAGSSSYNNISDNIITNNKKGIDFFYKDEYEHGSMDNIVSGNLISNNNYGIYIFEAASNIFMKNIITNNKFSGICGKRSPWVNITHNMITSNDDGINFWSSSEAYIANNIIENNKRGILLSWLGNNIVFKNNIRFNAAYGIYLTPRSHDNYIYHNNFINNSENAYDSGTDNRWNISYPSGGNYWDDYNGGDNYSGPDQNLSGSDGIGDTPHSIYDYYGLSNQDIYPQMVPITDIILSANTHGPYKGVINSSIQFIGSATGGFPPYTWHWDFGNGNTSDEQNPQFVYDALGNYNITLTVNDSEGNSDCDITTIAIKIINVDPCGPFFGVINESIHFTSSVSGGTPPYNWSWDFGDNTLPVNQQNPNHTYNRTGTYIVTVTVNDSEGISDNDTTTATVTQPLIADAHGLYTGTAGLPVQFYSSATDGVPPYTWLWDFGDDQSSDIQNPVHGYPVSGNYTVTLTVIDVAGNNATNITTAIILDTPPVHNINNDTFYWTIQSAVSDAQTGDAIQASNGVYYEHVSIPKPIYLIGGDVNRTIIDGGDHGTVVDIDVNGVFISGFTIRNSGQSSKGISIRYSDNNTIIGNKINSNNIGMEVYAASNNIISRNTIVSNTQNGIQFYYSSNNTLSGNIISLNNNGLYFGASCPDNLFIGNTISNNRGRGVDLYYSGSTSTNRFYHNKFINNTLDNARDRYNIWHDGYPSGGNYWSDYTGNDYYHGPNQNISGPDDIGDTPYNISGGTKQDLYPLMIVYSSLFHADAHGPYEGGINEPILFNGSATGGFQPYTYSWDFGDGNVSSLQNSSKSYTLPGNYTVILKVTDSQNNIDYDVTTATIYIGELVADADGPYIGVTGEQIQFNGSATGGIQPYTWQWDFGDGNTSEEQNPEYKYEQIGEYTVTLNVTDSRGIIANDTATVMVLPRPSSVYVDDDYCETTPGWGFDHFDMIQDGIDAVKEHGTIFVNNGTYHEKVIINKTINLTGENRNTTTINGSGNDYTIDLSADMVNITRFTIKNVYNSNIRLKNASYCTITINTITTYNGGYGIFLEDPSNNITISGNILTNNSFAILTFGSSNQKIFNNSIFNNFYGVCLFDSNENTIHKNTFLNSHGNLLSYGKKNTITDNMFEGNGINMFAETLPDTIEHMNSHTIENNTVNGKPLRYYKNVNNITIPSNTGQIIIANCTQVVMQNLTITDTDIAIQVGYSEGIIIKENLLTNLSFFGLILFSSINNTIAENTIINASGGGIIIFLSSDNNSITNNEIKGNDIGLYLGMSNSNRIYHNNFINNTISAWEDMGDSNQWDSGYPSGGNYWSDHNGSDNFSGPGQNISGSDGIADTPYNITGDGSQDRYPFMYPVDTTPEIRYIIIDLGVLGDENNVSYAYGINENGQIVGSSGVEYGLQEAFLWEASEITGLSTMGGLWSRAMAINEPGQIAGSSHTVDWHVRAFMDDNGVIEPTDDLGTLLDGNVSYADDINDLGQVVGYSYLEENQWEPPHAFIWNVSSGMIDLGVLPGYTGSRARAINDLSQVVGTSSRNENDSTPSQAFIWDSVNGIVALENIPGDTYSHAYDINNLEQVVGYSYGYDSEDHAFLWENGSCQELPSLGGPKSFASAINNLGQIVGSSTTEDRGPLHACLWENGSIYDLNDLISPFSGWELIEAYDINDNGWIVGYGRNHNGDIHAFLLTFGDIQYSYWAMNVEADFAGSGGSQQYRFSTAWSWDSITFYQDVVGAPERLWNESDFELLPDDSPYSFDVVKIWDIENDTVKWILDYDEESIPSHSHTAFELVLSADDVMPLFQIGVNFESDPMYKPYDYGWGPATDVLPEGMSVTGHINDIHFQVEIPVHYLKVIPDCRRIYQTPVTTEAYDSNDNGWIVGHGRNPNDEIHASLLTPIKIPSLRTNIFEPYRESLVRSDN